MSENWTRTEGVVVAAELDPGAVVAHLTAADVVARLEWYPGSENLLSLSVLADGEQRVATAPAGGTGVVPGRTLGELVDEIAEKFDADVLMDGLHADWHDDDSGAPDWAMVDDHPGNSAVDGRTVVLTSLAAHRVPVQAEQLRRTVTVAPCTVGGQQRRVLMTTGAGAELGVLGWEEEAYPVLRLQVDDEERTALLLVSPENDEDEGEDVVLFSWSMRSQLLPRYTTTNAEARRLAEDLLGDGVDAGAFAAAVPGADAEAVAASLLVPGADGLAAFVAALGLAPAVVDVLEGRADPGSLPGAVVHEPPPLPEPAEPVRQVLPAWLSRPAGKTAAGSGLPHGPGEAAGADRAGTPGDGTASAAPDVDAKPPVTAKEVAAAAKEALAERTSKPLPALTPNQQKWALRATLAGLGTAAAGAAVVAVIKGATKR